jgi:hypothetical protein
MSFTDGFGQTRKLYPVDEATKDPSFFTFRARLIQAVQRHDAAFLISILAPKITNSFGGDGGSGCHTHACV